MRASRFGWTVGIALLTAGCASVGGPSEPPLTDELGLDAMVEAVEGGDYRKIEAVLVQRGGEVVFEDYYGETGPETRVDPRSASKSITALVLGQAIEDGFIESVDQPLFSFFADEDLPDDDPARRAITLEDALTMSSALDCNDWEPSPGNEERMYDSSDWTRFALGIPVDSGYEREADTGRGRFSYCTAGVYLLGRVVEEATGEPFEDYARRKLFDPLGIEDPVWPRSPEGKVQTGGGLELRARDFAALGELVLDGLLRPERPEPPLVPRTWIRQMLQPHRKATPRDAYGYLWWIRDFRREGDPTPYPGFYMSGNGGNKAVVFPDLDAVVVVLSTNYNTRGMHDQTSDLVERYVLPALVER